MRRPRIFISLGERTRPLLRALLLELFFPHRKKSGSSIRNSIESAYLNKKKTYSNHNSAFGKAAALPCFLLLSFFSFHVKSAFFARRKESSKETRKGGEERVDSD